VSVPCEVFYNNLKNHSIRHYRSRSRCCCPRPLAVFLTRQIILMQLLSHSRKQWETDSAWRVSSQTHCASGAHGARTSRQQYLGIAQSIEARVQSEFFAQYGQTRLPLHRLRHQPPLQVLPPLPQVLPPPLQVLPSSPCVFFALGTQPLFTHAAASASQASCARPENYAGSAKLPVSVLGEKWFRVDDPRMQTLTRLSKTLGKGQNTREYEEMWFVYI